MSPTIDDNSDKNPHKPPASLPNAEQPVLWGVSPVEDGTRLDRFIKRNAPGLPPGLIQRHIRQKRVSINDRVVCHHGHPVVTGDLVRFPGYVKLGIDRRNKKPKSNDVSLAEAELVRSWVLYKDARCAVLNKPAGLPVQADTNERHLEQLLCGLGAGRYWLVHRLDKLVSGAIIVARDVGAAALMGEYFRSRSVSKLYWCLVSGVPKHKKGVIDADVDGKKAITRYRVVDFVGTHYAWLELEPRTGRKHQLRVHCSELLGTPIVGDSRFSADSDINIIGPTALHLCSRSVSFPRLTQTAGDRKGRLRNAAKVPSMVTVTAPLPPHMKEAWKRFGLNEKFG